MAKLSNNQKLEIFKFLNDRHLPWDDYKFSINANGCELVGEGGFSEVRAMEKVDASQQKYAVKIIGFNDSRSVHKEDVKDYEKEPVIQKKLSGMCNTILRIIDSRIISIELDNNGKIIDAVKGYSQVDTRGWLCLVLILMERLSPILEQNFSGDYNLTVSELEKYNEKEILQLGINIADALFTAKTRLSVVHRDVKLENIFYDADNHLYKLGDFGIARITNAGSASTKGAGTSGYKAPEVEDDNDKNYSYSADVYSFGIVLYLLMNDLKFPASNGYYVNRLEQYNPNNVIIAPAHGGEELQQLILSMISYFPKNRPDIKTVIIKLKEIKIKYFAADDVEKMNEGNEDNNIIKSEISEGDKQIFNMPVSGDLHKAIQNISKSPYINDVKKDVFKSSAMNENAVAATPSTPSINNVVAEVQDNSDNVKSVSTNNSTTVNNGDTHIDEIPATKAEKTGFGIFGIVFIVLGITFLRINTGDNGFIGANTLYYAFCIIFSLISIIKFIVTKRETGKVPYWINLLIFVFCIFVIVNGGYSLFLLIMIFSLFIGQATEMFATTIAAWLNILLVNVFDNTNQTLSANEKYIWIFFTMLLIGYMFSIMSDQKTYSSQFILATVVTLSSILVIIFGSVLWIINKILTGVVSKVLMNLHFIYTGIVVLVVSFILVAVLSFKGGN